MKHCIAQPQPCYCAQSQWNPCKICGAIATSSRSYVVLLLQCVQPYPFAASLNGPSTMSRHCCKTCLFRLLNVGPFNSFFSFSSGKYPSKACPCSWCWVTGLMFPNVKINGWPFALWTSSSSVLSLYRIIGMTTPPFGIFLCRNMFQLMIKSHTIS